MKDKSTRHTSAADTTAAVEAFMLELEHPFKAEVQAIREAILGASPEIAEGIKWKSPSFRTDEYFATVNLREKGGVGVILHLGAKVKELPAEGLSIEDPSGLLDWLAKDRAKVKFESMRDFTAKRSDFVVMLRSWIRAV